MPVPEDLTNKLTASDPAHQDLLPTHAEGEQLELKGIARLYGEPLLKLPQDLYIPPDALEVFLEAFEGPLDLLLYLIRRRNFNILDIPMAELTRQYLAYVDEIRSHHLELAAEYLLMAAMLIDIKSRMLLPIQKREADAETEDPRAELARRLLEYESIKQGAQQLDCLPQVGREFFIAQVCLDQHVAARLPEVSAEDLKAAWFDIMRRAKLIQHHKITRDELSVREIMTVILRELQQRRFAEFQELFDTAKGLPHAVVTFVALLELTKESLVELTQAECYAPIYVRLSYTPS
ncbi:MAG: segregation/condensation protein A [Betaproteobacteria bacterium]|jgi:segregation and condensation protein A|nr:segregation/condensation protein A [Pseudomonadota bacterium]NBO03270.1 segregation/condensation protein A [Betaproteobacteria bacterium]HAB47576.1 segregation/condensation protein A [Lautropia sp.]NBO95820.1 segregation/condensation protein A [Betaproteobacteria bacterium]NBP34564.1 segregation/condensation protein A [Betaproteobacteria bacterium]